MKALLLTTIVLFGSIVPIAAQKKSTLLGDIVIGELTGMDEATREITIKYPGKEGPETFIGILTDGYKLKRDDGSRGDMKLNEILPGMRIRVFYKSGKVNKIQRIDFLGKDEHVRLRNQLNIDPTMPVVRAENDALPAASPLKIYPAVAYNTVRQSLAESIDKWNRKNGDSYGKLEIVSDLQQADISIVVARGSDTMVVVLPDIATDSKELRGEFSQATSYLVVKDPAGLKVLWQRVVPVYTTVDMDALPRTFEVVMAELEKRMKARSRNPKK